MCAYCHHQFRIFFIQSNKTMGSGLEDLNIKQVPSRPFHFAGVANDGGELAGAEFLELTGVLFLCAPG